MINWRNLWIAAFLTLPLSLFVAYCGANALQCAVVCAYAMLCMEITSQL